jgi:hypothetical protein
MVVIPLLRIPWYVWEIELSLSPKKRRRSFSISLPSKLLVQYSTDCPVTTWCFSIRSRSEVARAPKCSCTSGRPADKRRSDRDQSSLSKRGNLHSDRHVLDRTNVSMSRGSSRRPPTGRWLRRCCQYVRTSRYSKNHVCIVVGTKSIIWNQSQCSRLPFALFLSILIQLNTLVVVTDV